MRFGVHAGLQQTTTDELRRVWSEVECAGYEWISIWDHFYAADFSGGSRNLEAVAMHSALALETERVRCGSLVYSVGYRHPAVLAKAVATIDQLSGGRVVLGMGAGWHEGEYTAYGLPFPSAGVRLRQLDEALQCIRALFTAESVDFAGEFFELRDARLEPKPVQPRLPIWVGGGGERVTLRLAAEHADGWNIPFVPPDEFARKTGVLAEHCAAVGRDPDTVTKAVNVAVGFRDGALAEQFGALADHIGRAALSGSDQEIVDRVGEYRDAGAEWLILALRAPFDVEGVQRFAQEIAPHFA